MQIKGSYDVVVVGGGTSGVAAAIASARSGADTLLIERVGALGGQMNVSGPPVLPMPTSTTSGTNASSAGSLPKPMSASSKKDTRSPTWNPTSADGTLRLCRPGLVGTADVRDDAGKQRKLLLHSLAVDVVKEGPAVRGVTVENVSGRQTVLARSSSTAPAKEKLRHAPGLLRNPAQG